MSLTTLYRPVNQKEWDLIVESGCKAFPPRLPEQPIFYPVTNLEYAREITVKWNVPAYGIGLVTAFDLSSDYLKKFPVKNVGNTVHDELWVPAEELDEFNSQIVGNIRLVEEH